jgi:hypothetical protein
VAGSAKVEDKAEEKSGHKGLQRKEGEFSRAVTMGCRVPNLDVQSSVTFISVSPVSGSLLYIYALKVYGAVISQFVFYHTRASE